MSKIEIALNDLEAAILSQPLSVSATAPESLQIDKQKLFLFLIRVAREALSTFAGVDLPVGVQALQPELFNYVKAGLTNRPAADGTLHVLSYPGLDDLLAGLVKPALNFAAATYGDTLANLVLTQKDEILKVIGDPVIDVAQKVIDGLRSKAG